MTPLTEGLVQVYTGSGKGKTTAALGLALRALGHGLRVCVIQFLKGACDSGERAAAARLAPELEIHAYGAPQWGERGEGEDDRPWWELPPSAEDRAQAQEGMVFARRAVASGEWDIVVLDEVFGALRHELIVLDHVLSLICAKPPHVELVLTGREAPPEIVKTADLVTHMEAVKHPFQRGVNARRGIEY